MSKKSFGVNLKSVLTTVLGMAISATGYAAVTITNQDSDIRSSGNVASATRSESWTVEERNANQSLIFNRSINESRTASTNTASANATINSSVSDSMIVGTGSATASASYNDSGTGSSFINRPRSNSESQFSVTFEITTATFFELDGTLEFNGERFDGGVTSSLRNNSSFSSTFNLSFGDSNADGDFLQNISLSGMLDPGTYIFSTLARANSDPFSLGQTALNTASYDVSLTLGSWDSLTPPASVPVPAAIWLFGSSLLGLQIFNRKKNT